jgi:D-amino-acid oxidase
MLATTVEVAVIGAGVVGCAVASALARAGHEVALLEREARAGTGITARNSGVIHGGLYYRPGSNKARACVEGRDRLYAWAREHDVPHQRIGKLVLACGADEWPALEALAANARASGVESCELIDARELARRQPGLPRHPGALWSPDTGIVDAHALTRSLWVDAEAHGALVLAQCPVLRGSTSGDRHRLETGRGVLESEFVINCAGLFADEVAHHFGLEREVRACRGDYFRLQTHHRYKHLLYPVKRRPDAGLGVHLTIELDGGLRLGPDVEWVTDKQDFRPAPHKHAAFLEATRRLLGPVDDDALRYDGCGLRPKLHAPEEPPQDFELIEHPSGVWHLLGIESPGLTAALALAEWTRERLDP